MDIRKLQRAIVDGLEDVKAVNILVFNTEHLSALFERVIIASGTSNRQTKSLAASVRDSVRANGFPVLRTEGESNGEWIIVDCGAAVAHIMQPAIRDYYHLEEIWGDKPVKMKLEATTTRLVKASEDDDEAPVSRRAARAAAQSAQRASDGAQKATRTSVKGTVPKKAGAKPRPLGSPTLRTPAKKAVVEKVSVPGTVAGRAAVAAAAGRKTAASKAAPKVAAKVPAKKAAPRKTAAAKGAVTRTVGTKGSAPTTTEVTRTIVVKKVIKRAPAGASRTAATSAGRAAISRPGTAIPAPRKTVSRSAAPASPTRSASRSGTGSSARPAARKAAAPRKTSPRK
ncbi:hypothetical protein BH09PSE5_BH09PSE5_13850 [soil metagenome]